MDGNHAVVSDAQMDSQSIETTCGKPDAQPSSAVFLFGDMDA